MSSNKEMEKTIEIIEEQIFSEENEDILLSEDFDETVFDDIIEDNTLSEELEDSTSANDLPQKKIIKENDLPYYQIPDFTFDINPGLEVRNAYFTDEEISYEDSIFSKSQYFLINKMLNAEIEKLTAEHKEKLDTEKRTAWQNGNQAGIKQTQNQMLASVQTVIEQLELLIKNLTKYTTVFMEHYEQQALKLMIKIARKVIDTEVITNPEIVLNNLKRSLELLNEKEEIKILVNPEDIAIVNENLQKLSLSINLPENIEIVSNENILAGGCKIDFKVGSIDSDLETQFEEIKRQILKND
ncbi:MAG: FliH/SctL family protein [Candidatus Cloacimonetes bacterium]|nr:FliH/SctL family protein [Candidatus Cloacimonadota bacterium]